MSLLTLPFKDQIPTEISHNTVLGDACGEQPTARNVEGASIPTQVIDTSTSAAEKPKRGEYTQRYVAPCHDSNYVLMSL